MSDEKSTVTVPAAESAERRTNTLQAERDAESIARVVRAASEAAGVRPEAITVGSGLHVDGGDVRVKGQIEASVTGYVSAFLEQRTEGAREGYQKVHKALVRVRWAAVRECSPPALARVVSLDSLLDALADQRTSAERYEFARAVVAAVGDSEPAPSEAA